MSSYNYEQSQPLSPTGGRKLAKGKASHNQAAAAPSDYVPFSILTTLCCNLPLGLIALYFSCKIRGYVREGNYNMADRYSHVALTINIVGLGMGFFLWAMMFFIFYHMEMQVPLLELNAEFNLTHTFNITE